MGGLRLFAIASLFAGVALLGYAFATAGHRSSPASSGVQGPFDRRATPTPAATSTPLASPASTPDASPTEAPYDGNPVSLAIPTLGVAASIEQIGILPGNTLDVPKDPHDVGWYRIYDRPGVGGNAVFAAHVDWWPDIRGPFHDIATLQVDGSDTVTVTMDNQLQYRYVVIRVTRYNASTIAMGDVISPKDRPAGEEWITLITCGGNFVPDYPGGPGEYVSRDVVVAKRIQ